VAAQQLAEVEARRAQFDGVSLLVAVKVAGEGKLFGSVGVAEIAHAIESKGLAVEKREIRLPASGPIRMVGEYDIILHLHSEVDVAIKLKVVAEGEVAQ
jgi:large subunit ribosomal protein L9